MDREKCSTSADFSSGQCRDASSLTLRYAFIVLDRLSAALPDKGAATHYLILSESQIVALQGYASSDLEPGGNERLLPHPPIGAILDDAFIKAHPGVLTRLVNLSPVIPGTNTIFNLSAGQEGLLDWQLSRAFGLSGRFLKELGAGQLEIARLQQIAHDHLEALQEAQRFVEQAPSPKPRLSVFLPPAGAVLRPSDLFGSTSLLQVSKREFRAVHCFEFHVANVGSGVGAPIVVRLSTAHSREVLATWTLPVSSFDKGWNRFDVPFISRPLHEPVAIEIGWSSEAPPDIAFSLGEITADPRLGLRRSDGSVDERSLALRIYNGVPGVRLPYSGWGKVADAERSLGSSEFIVLDELLERAMYHSGLAQPDAGLLFHAGDRAGLFLHPVPGTTHIAVIRNLRIDGVRAVVADVMLDHDSAAATEFGLFVASAKGPLPAQLAAVKSAPPKWRQVAAALRGAGKAQPPDPFDGKATWLSLAGRKSGQIIFEIPEDVGGCFDIYLATRPTTAGTEYAWAHFVNLAVVCGQHRS